MLSFLTKAEDDAGYPNLSFERFYQQGLMCHRWRLSRLLVRQAFRHLCAGYKGPVALWQIKAFVYGSQGNCADGLQTPLAPEDYQWPSPPDRSWEMVVCVYPDGLCDLDFVHPVARVFWSEGNGFLKLPTYDTTLMGRWWFEEAGFDILFMQDEMQVMIGSSEKHLKLI